MNADKIIAAIKDALGNPSGGPVADAMPLISSAVNKAMGVSTDDDTPPPAASQGDQESGAAAKERRVIKAQEVRATQEG